MAGPMPIDLSGKLFKYGISILANDPSGCGFGPVTVQLTGNKPNAPPAPATPADLVALNTWMDPQFPAAGETFTVWFTCQNIGGKATGAFTARLELDNGAQAQDIAVTSLSPGEAQSIWWRLDGGLPAGDHWVYCYLDSTGIVAESTKANNVGYNGFIVG